MSISKKKKKSGPFLLLEPTIEEEQQSDQRQVLASSWSKSSSSQSFHQPQTGNKGFTLEPTGRQMSASSVTATKHVINTTSSSSNNNRSQHHSSRSQLTNLLAFLFGSLLIVYLTTRYVSTATINTTRDTSESGPIITTTTTISGNSLFKSSTTPFNSFEAGSVSEPSSESETPTTVGYSATEATTKSHFIESNENSTLSTTTSPELDAVSGTGATTTSPIMSSLLPVAEENGTTPVIEASASSAEGNESNDAIIEDEEPTVASGGDGGRLNSGFIVDMAGEAADLLLANLKARGGEADADNQELPESTGESAPAVERRDTIGGNLKVLTTEEPPETTTTPSADSDSQLKIAMETYARWRATGDDIIELFSRKMLPVIVEHGYDIDTVTVTGLLQVFNGIRAIKPWALKLLDASAKITPGLLVGTQADFGDYDECLNVRVDDPSGLGISSELDESTGLPSSTLVGRYCLADIEFPKPPRVKLATRNQELNTDFEPIQLRRPLLNFSETAAYKDTIFVETGNFFHMLYVDPLRVGICLTNKIDPNSFAQVLNKLLEEFKVSINFHGRCVTKYDKITWTIQQKVSAWVLLGACSLVALCTCLDVLHSKLNKLPLPGRFRAGKLSLQSSLQRYRPLFTSFSIIRNTKRLFKPQLPAPSSSPERRLSDQQHCSTSTSGCSSYSSSESSPSIERRSSTGGSASLLISDSSIISNSVASSVPFKNKPCLFGHQFTGSSGPSMATSGERQSPNLLCLHGIRVITMTWMIVNHTYLFGGFFVLWAYRRLIDISEWPKSFSFQLVINGWLTVETYFFLGATIIVLTMMPIMKAKKFTYTTYILHRLLRLLPAYTGLICLNFLWPLVSSGPVWLVKGKSFIQTPCENYLWTNYLFINNWIWPEKQCMVHTWFLSADFQLYLMAPLIVYLLCRRPTLGHSVNIIVAIIASMVSGFVIYANKLMPTTLINKLEFDSIKQQLSYSYFATYQHVGPYCLGIFTGYLLYKRPHVQLPKHLTWALWILLPPLSLTTLFLTYLWNGAYDEPSLINPSPIVSALYVAIHRTIWTSLVAWIVFASATGRAKLLSSILSHSMFVPLSRLSFSIYLVHLPVIMFRALNLRHTIEWTDSNILWEACGNFIVSLIVGYFVNVTFESPITNLEQVIFGRGKLSGKLDSIVIQEKCKTQNPKLRPQISSKTSSSEPDSSDDSKSAKSSDLPDELIKASSLASHKETNQLDSSALGISETASQLLDRQMSRWAWDEGAAVGKSSSKMKSLRQKQKLQQREGLASVSRLFGNIEPPSISNYGGVVESGDEDDGDTDDLMMTPDSDSPPVPNSLKESLGGQNRLQQVAPAVKPIRRFSAFESPSSKLDRSSSIYQMAPSEYQRYTFSRQTPMQLQRMNQLGGSLFRSPQYATLARTSKFNRNDIRASERHEWHQRQYHMGPTSTRSQLGGGSRSSQRGASLIRSGVHLEEDVGGVGLRRQGRYNTLTGTGSREWRQQIGPDLDDKWLVNRGGRSRVRDEDFSHTISDTGNWVVQPGAMIPRIDSSTLRGASLRNSDATRTSSIVEEEREDIR